MRAIRNEQAKFDIFIRVRPERVFDALATAQGLDEWFTTGTSLDPQPGGAIQFRWKDWGLERFTGEILGRVVEWNRPTRYSFNWRADSGTYDTLVVVTFDKTPDGTILRLVESGYEETPAGMQDLLNRVSGWAHVLTLLKFYLEHGIRDSIGTPRND